MARVRSVDFLPEIFQTPTNRKFLNSTVDQLIQEPKLKPTQGYIGRKTAPGKSSTDGYLLEPTERRGNYQLEPGVIFNDENGNPVDALSYIGLLDGLQTKGADTSNHDRLFSSEMYSWSPFFDFDKFVNYSQYFWLPSGPDSVDVAEADVLLTNEYDVTEGDNVYNFEGFDVSNPKITLLRSGSYTFNVPEGFYIQTEPGVDGTVDYADNISSRDVYGVYNNGGETGTVTFNVPDSNAQSFYNNLNDIGTVDLATFERYDSINNRYVSSLSNIDGIASLENKTIVFLDDQPGDADDLGWRNLALYDNEDFAEGVFDETTYLDTLDERYQIFRIQYIYEDPENPYIRLVPIQSVNQYDTFAIEYGEEFSNISFFKNAGGFFERTPLLTAGLDRLYYQDANDPYRFGIIDIVDQGESAVLDVNEIIGATEYISTNGVEFTNGLKVIFRGSVIPEEYTDVEYYVEGVGESIRLVKVTDLVVPEPYSRSFTQPWDTTPWDSTSWDDVLNAPLQQDYITINRSSNDINAWSRSNRWFHIDVIKKTAEYNNVVAEIDNNQRADRPIIEFDPDLRLFDHGTNGKKSVDVIDFVTIDALSNVNGAASHTVDSFNLSDGARVIFANDNDLEVRSNIYVVEIIDAENDGNTEINLVLAEDAQTYENDVVVASNGLTQQGNVYTYDGVNWNESQQKVSVNQAPLFDVFDIDGYSLSELDIYPSTTFAGTKLFSYAEGTGTPDSILGFPLQYLNIDNLGDIVFENNLYKDTFLYVRDNVSEVDTPISIGYIRKYSSRTEYTNEIGWVKSIEDTRQAQIFEMIYDENVPVVIDITPSTDLEIPAVCVTINSQFINSSNYTVADKTITFNNGVVSNGDELQIKVCSDEISETAYYQIPANLESNIFNENTTDLTLGTIRNHFNSLAQNILTVEGDINGANNLRDLGEISRYGSLIVQQSAPLAFAAMFMRDKEYEFFNALNFVSRQYEKFKNQLINWVEKNEVFGLTPAEILDAAIKEINAGKSINNAFYWSDMLPSGSDFESTIYEITAISTDTFATLNTYDFTQANTNAILVYHNDVLLTKDTDYTVADDGPRITLLFEPIIGDVVTINEYNTTVGSNVPSTPTKLGLYPRFRPQIIADNTYTKTVDVIKGHDGSITASFGKDSQGEYDIRDRVLLEFETRIYNNIKIDSDVPLVTSDVVPGMFRDTEYTEEEIINILTPPLLTWLGWNKIDHRSQDYNKADEKTWNYSSSRSKIDNEEITKGHWRGVYNQFYDTDAPHERPWEMLGLTERPDWWFNRYGPAPYTAGNLVLWDDIEAGLVKDPDGEYVIEKFKRPGLKDILPVDGEGNLLMPLESVIGGYSAYDFKRSWEIGDHSPAETAWRKSSEWPFVVQALLALTKPAQYFAFMADRDRYKYSAEFDQYLYDNRSRIDIRDIEILDQGIVKHSYINWIVNYNKHFGYETVEQLKTDMANLDVSLVHHMASFTDKNSLKIFTDKSSPDSTNNSLLLPDESYELLIYKNQPIDEIIYSSVIVQKLEDGYSVIGNSSSDPYFRSHVSIPTGRYVDITVGRDDNTSSKVKMPLDFSDDIQYIPYGHIFSNRTAVVHFLAGYDEYLKRQGLKFNTSEGAQEVSWKAMAQEFIYWTDQGWAPQSVINLNPAASELEFERELHIVDSLKELSVTEQPLNQNREPLEFSDFAVDRIDNNFKLTMLDGNVISYLKFKLTNFEHLLILDNSSIFNDLIYDPVTGVRQQRVKLSGFTTYEWNGQLDAQGFIYNEDNIQDWSSTKNYNRGDIVKFKNAYWAASDRVQPSDEFNFNLWNKTDYDKINKGLLPNLATKAEQQLDFYNNKTANLESDVDLMSFGLTGFRSRDYLQSLDLDDISQINIYSGMIETKGTVDTLNLFKGVDLNNEVVDYDIFENWAIKRAQYGATNSRSYFELQLNEDLHHANPSTVELVTTTTQDFVTDQQVLVNDIYKQSIKHSSKSILPTVQERNLDIALPSAGFVNPEDVDIQAFDVYSIDPEADISEGTLVWVAKDVNKNWQVYKAVGIAPKVIKAIDNLNGTLTLEFDVDHELAINGIIHVSGFDEKVNGTHIIQSVSSVCTLEIPGELAKNQTIIDDQVGDVYKFISGRLTQPSDIADSDFNNTLFSDDKVWIADLNGKQVTYEKDQPFDLSTVIDKDTGTGSKFGFSVAQGSGDAGLMVGDPTYSLGGGISVYNRVGLANYIINRVLTVNGSTNIANYGESVDLSENWSIAGAPGTDTLPGVAAVIERNSLEGTFIETQLLVSQDNFADPTSNFGKAVTLSDDENWAYVGESSHNKVYVYQRHDIEEQSLSFIATEGQTVVDVSDNIVASAATQLSVVVNDVPLSSPAEYTFDGTNVTFVGALSAGDTVVIVRKNVISHDGNPPTLSFSVTDLVTATDTESVQVSVSGILQRPYIDYTCDGTNVTFTSPPPLGTKNIAIRSESHFKYIATITAPGGATGFGSVIDVTTDSSHIAIGAQETTVSGVVGAGNVYVYNRVTERFVISDEAQLVYTTSGSPIRSVYVNGVRLVEDSGLNINSQYSVSGNVITITDVDVISVGDFLDADTNGFELLQELTASAPSENANFGNAISTCRSKCSIYVGAQNDLAGQGSVTRFVNRTRMYGSVTSSVQDPTVTIGDSIRINNIEVTFTGTTATDVRDDINNTTIPNVRASVADGYLTIELVNKEIQSIANRLDVLPGTGTAFDDIGLVSYYVGQVLYNPIDSNEQTSFGSAVHIDHNQNQLVISAKSGSQWHTEDAHGADTTGLTSDNATDTADNADSTQFIGTTTGDVDHITSDTTASTVDEVYTTENAGVVYTFDLLPDSDSFSEGKLVFGQQITISDAAVGDKFGNAVTLEDNSLVVASVGYAGEGRVITYANYNDSLSWVATTVQKDTVDTSLINSLNIYDEPTQNVRRYLDYIDPLNGKILGVAEQNIDFITPYDPTVYQSTNLGVLWGTDQVDKIWWDISTVCFLDYNQGDAKRATKLWGKVFPGSSVDVYQWIESDVPPSQYAGTGEVYNVEKYVTRSILDRSGTIQNKYYYWVKGINTIPVNSQKTLSTEAIASYIESPASSGIPYAALVSPSTIGLYNCKPIISGTDSILHVEYDKVKNDNNVYVEYDLYRENNPNDFFSDGLYKKFQDSLCGVDTLGNKVPDPALNETDKYGIDFRPRKSMFVDRFAALESYIMKVNDILKKYTVAELGPFPLLDSEELEPAEGQLDPNRTPSGPYWDKRLLNLEELTFQDLSLVGTGYRYLVASDEENNGLWTIYEVLADETVQLINVQSYDTKRFWYLEDWYDESYSPFSKIDYVVDTSSLLNTLQAESNAIARVISNANDKWEIYQLRDEGWTRVGVQEGTIQFRERIWNYEAGRYGWDVEVFDAQYFDEQPDVELRNIIRAINEELLVGDLLSERAATILSIFNYIYAEQSHVEWLQKTSLIDVTQKVRSLSQYDVYQKDNQDYLLDYIRETKPYHTKIKDFLLSYDGFDLYQGSATDFDCPAYYDENFDLVISPVLDDGAILKTSPSNFTADAEIWQTEPWLHWYDNHRLQVVSVIITNPGTGYTIPPQVEVIGDADEPAQMRARLGPSGTIAEVIVEDPGSGYLSNPSITFVGGNGTGATASVVTENGLVRASKTTIKYDRYEYQSNVVEWEPDTVYEQDQLVRVLDAVYKLINADGVTASPATFDPLDAELVDIETLSGIDRTSGFYVSDVNNPGLDLSLLINGIAFPGVEVDGISFENEAEQDELIDTIYESAFLDTYLGTRSTDVNVDGGEFIDTYHSHAPEELVPGAIFDTLDITVTSRPGADYLNDGHAFAISSTNAVASGSTAAISIDGLIQHPIIILVSNISTGKSLYEGIDFTIDWPNQTVNVTSGITAGDTIKVFAYEIGGGDQLYRNTYTGLDFTGDTINIPVNDSEIYEAIIFVNGTLANVTSITNVDIETSAIQIDVTPADTDFVTVTIMGYDTPQREESYPIVQTFVYGTDTVDPGAEAIEGTNRHNAIVEVNGLRLRPPEGRRHIANGTDVNFLFPKATDYAYGAVADGEVDVFINGEKLTLGVDYTVSPPVNTTGFYGASTYGDATYFDPTAVDSPRWVTLTTPPAEGDRVGVIVRHASEYWFSGSEVTFVTPPAIDDLVAVTTFGDTSELDLLTKVYVGPKLVKAEEVSKFDTVGFDTSEWDLQGEVDVFVNVFDFDREITDPERLWVTVNGERLAANEDYEIVNGTQIQLLSNVIGANDVVAVTSFSENIVLNGSKFRLFKDMRDNVGMYKIFGSETVLTQDLLPEDDIIYVNDASVLGQPNLATAKFGILTINGERITYRERDLINNTVSGLRRGTAGTGVGELHSVDDIVHDVSAKSLVQWDYDRIWYAQGDGTASNGVPLENQTTIPAVFIKK